MLCIEGFAAPYREQNSYGETFATHSFAGKLHPVDMGILHEYPVGIWDDVWEDLRGIWVRGRLLAPFAVANVARLMRDLPELSVSWCCKRGEKQRDRRECAPGEFMPCVVGPNDNNGLTEISFVDSGSFRNTHWKVIT